MPKKFKGVNTKAEETRARREAVKVAEREKKQKEEEDKLWEDNDKHVLRKQQRKVSLSLRPRQHFEFDTNLVHSYCRGTVVLIWKAFQNTEEFLLFETSFFVIEILMVCYYAN